jgi:hypothetical protein
MIQLVRKPVPLAAFKLVDQADMLEALTFLADEGWRGALSQSDDGWSLEINIDEPARQVSAEVGDWLVFDGGLLRKMSDADVAASYDEVES